jgi:macrolide transport system ATP-binding/permease protein
MRLPRILSLRLRSLLAHRKVEQELDEELRYHFERQIEEYIALGTSPEEARYAALRSIAGIEQRKEECRDMRGWNLLDNLLQDLRYAIRQLRKSPGFAFVAILVLALGVSGAISIFGIVDAALIRPLPYRDQSRLVAAFESSPGYPRSWLSYADFADWKKLNTVFTSIDAYALNGGFTLTTSAGAEPASGTRVSAGFFETLGTAPMLGRDFRPGEDSPAATPAVILTYPAWQKRFAGKPDVLGKVVTLNGQPSIIIGVLPREFQFAPYGGAEFFTTLRSSGSCESTRNCKNLTTIARLKDGVSFQAASAEMNLIARRLQQQYPESNRDFGAANLAPLRDLIVGDVRPVLLVLLSGAALLLLIAWANVTTLLLARSENRSREIAVRGALGASSSRLFHQFAMEGFVLAAAGGLCGLILAAWGMRFLATLVPSDRLADMPYLQGLGLNARAVACAAGLSFFAGILFALVPAIRTSLSEMMEGLKQDMRGTAGAMLRRFGSNLVIVEVALAMVLMVGAGLLGKSLYNLLTVNVGLNPSHLALLQVDWAPGNYEADRQKVALERQILQQVSALPGVKSVGIALTPPVDSGWGTASFHVAGRPNRGETQEVFNRQVSARYFATLETPLLRGRYFREDEDASKPLVAIVNRTLARRYFAGEDPLGKQIYYDWDPRKPMEIVGVIEDIHEGGLDGLTWPALYVPFDQNPVGGFAVVVRTPLPEQSLFGPIGATIHHIDRGLSLHGQMSMTDRINQSPAAYLHRASAWLAGSFAALAFLLGGAGLYGVVAYSVSRRTREIGIRMALGAAPQSMHRLIVREASALVGMGTLLGIGGSLAAAQLMHSLLFGVSSWDTPTLLAVILLLTIAALLASYLPARRAASVNPVEALRQS